MFPVFVTETVLGAGSSMFTLFPVFVMETGTGRGVQHFYYVSRFRYRDRYLARGPVCLHCFPSSLQRQVPGAGSKMFTANVGLDNYYLEYEVKVGAYNDLGSGPNSTDTIVMSAEGSMYMYYLEYNLKVFLWLCKHAFDEYDLRVSIVWSFMFRFFWTRSDGSQTLLHNYHHVICFLFCGRGFFPPTQSQNVVSSTTNHEIIKTSFIKFAITSIFEEDTVSSSPVGSNTTMFYTIKNCPLQCWSDLSWLVLKDLTFCKINYKRRHNFLLNIVASRAVKYTISPT